MEITGKIIQVLEARGGVSQRTGTEWKVQSYVLETMDQYPRKMMFEVFGADKIQNFNIQVGETMIVSFDVDAHEYNGRWYNQIRAWKVDRNINPGLPGEQAVSADIPPFAAAPAPVAAPAAPAGVSTPSSASAFSNPSIEAQDPNDQLPF